MCTYFSTELCGIKSGTSGSRRTEEGGGGLHRESARSSERRDRPRRRPCRFWVRHRAPRSGTRSLALSPRFFIPLRRSHVLPVRDEILPREDAFGRSVLPPVCEKSRSENATRAAPAVRHTHANGAAPLVQLPGSWKLPCGQAMHRAARHLSRGSLTSILSADQIGKRGVGSVQEVYRVLFEGDKIDA